MANAPKSSILYCRKFPPDLKKRCEGIAGFLGQSITEFVADILEDETREMKAVREKRNRLISSPVGGLDYGPSSTANLCPFVFLVCSVIKSVCIVMACFGVLRLQLRYPRLMDQEGLPGKLGKAQFDSVLRIFSLWFFPSCKNSFSLSF